MSASAPLRSRQAQPSLRIGVVAHVAVAAGEGRRAMAEELVTVLAHDLRNLLTPLKGRIAMIEQRARGEGRADYARDAQDLVRTVARLQQLTTDLLDVRRLEDGLFTVHPEPLDFAALVRETVRTLRTDDADVRTDTPEELVLLADADRLRQALENVLANALRYSPHGVPVEVRVTREHRADGAWAIATVRDHGPGIPVELRPRLFTRFAVGPSSVGLGIGLYLAHEIMAAHDGTLTLDSAPGEGARFRLALPIEPSRYPHA